MRTDKEQLLAAVRQRWEEKRLSEKHSSPAN
jgi:hypothetical protein